MSTEKTLVGPYVLHEKLGHNRRHNVYRATHEETGDEVALKLVNISSRVERSTALKKIQLESKILQRLDHPNLVKTLDAGVVDEKLYIVMEKIEGESLSSILSRRGKLAWDLAIDYAAQIAEGLNYIHQQELVHLKLNPDKILITPDGRLKIADLRLNRARKRRWDDARKRVLDIAAYMAPEQMTDSGGTFKSDIYGLGVVLFEMITGKLPFEPDTLPRLIKAKQENMPPRITAYTLECPMWVDNLVAQLLMGNPHSRPHSTYALLVSLREIQRMNAEGRSVAEELTRGFNPLTAGQDKTEAFSVLGRKKNREPMSNARLAIPLLSIALLGSVVLTATLFWLAIRPPSEEKLYENAVAAMESEELDEQQLLKAKRHLEPLVERFPNGPHFEEATDRLQEVDARLAEFRMKRRYRLGRDPKCDSERLAIQAWQLTELGDRESAIETYERLLELDDSHEDAPGYVALAERSIVRLHAEIEADPETVEANRERFLEKLAEAAQLRSDGKLVRSHELLTALVQSYDDREGFEDLVERAETHLANLSSGATDDSQATDEDSRPDADETAGDSQSNDGPTDDDSNDNSNDGSGGNSGDDAGDSANDDGV